MSKKRSRRKRSMLAAGAGLAALTLPSSGSAIGPANVLAGAGSLGGAQVVAGYTSFLPGNPSPNHGRIILNGLPYDVVCAQIVQEGTQSIAYAKIEKGGVDGTLYMKVGIDVEPGISTTPVGGISPFKSSVDKCGAGAITAKKGDGLWHVSKKQI